MTGLALRLERHFFVAGDCGNVGIGAKGTVRRMFEEGPACGYIKLCVPESVFFASCSSKRGSSELFENLAANFP